MKLPIARLLILLIALAALTGCGSAPVQNLQTTFQQTFYAPCGPAFYVREMAWSPDGSRLAYVAGSGSGTHDIFVAEIATGWTARATSLSGDEESLVWSPDGSHLLFMVRDGGQPYGPYVVGGDGSGLADLVDSNGLTEVSTPYAWSPDGSAIAISAESADGQPALYLLRLADETITPLVTDLVYQPAWSPDGRRIAFTSPAEFSSRTAVFDLHVIDADGSNLRTVASGLDRFAAITWSPDSTRLGFLTGMFANNLWLNVVNADGTGLQVLDSTGWVDQFVWLPDSQHLLYRTGSEVISIRVDRQEKQSVRSVVSWGSLSPDAVWVAALVDAPPGYHQEIVLQALDGSRTWQLTRNPGNQLCFKLPI